jgi:MFS family permease
MIILGGFIFDMFGRRLTIYYVLLIAGFALVFFPVVAPSHTMYIVLVSIVTLMIAPLLTSSPLIQDYVEKDSMAKANALSLIGLCLGRVAALGLLY